MPEDPLARIAEHRLVPVVQIRSAEQAVPLADALLEGGLPCVEITFRTDAAAAAISAIARDRPEVTVGAGTVLSPPQVDAAVHAGARFIVSPGTNPEVVARCAALEVRAIPGVCTPTEIESALGHGLSVLKFFPASVMGGPSMLKAFAGPYRDVRFIPTGGIDASNAAEYLALPNVLAVAGTWMVKADLLERGELGAVADLVKQAVSLVRDVGGAATR
jgi:2-dehydro-3-deoxyphosphogluconate aldolase/(4S)-4-hydroxy-2-oxoglutarate aldolase